MRLRKNSRHRDNSCMLVRITIALFTLPYGKASHWQIHKVELCSLFTASLQRELRCRQGELEQLRRGKIYSNMSNHCNEIVV